MRKLRVLLLVPLMLLLATGITYAAFDNSHHDLRSYGLGRTDGCFHCHGRTDTNAMTAQAANFGDVGGLCLARCHSGAGILTNSAVLQPTPAPSVAPADYTVNTPAQDYTVVYFSRSHGRTKANNTLNGSADPMTGAAAYPYMGAGTTIECTSCHSVHDNANAPFIWAPLAASGTNTRDSFCDKCHTLRATNSLQAAAPDGNHPVDFAVDNTAAASRTGNTRHGRRIFIQKYGAALTTPIFDIADPAAATMINTAGSWAMGGHLSSGQNAAMVNWTGGGSTQQMGCYTCHAAHRTNVNGENNLVVVETFDAAVGWNPLCVGCHGAATTRANDILEWNVGTTSYGHPVGSNTDVSSGQYTSSVGGFRFAIAAVTYTNAQNGNQFGTQGEVMCSTCHKVHGGIGMSMANMGQTTYAACKRCHTGVGIPNQNDFSKGGAVVTGHNVANSHHVTRATLAAGTVAQANESVNQNLTVANPSWRNTTTGLGDFASGMDCADCHTFNNTAHNW